MNKMNKKTVGIICLILGGIFFVAGIVLFILFNYVNLYAQKVDATIISSYDIDNEGTMIELAYRVGGEMVVASTIVPDKVPDDEFERTIYYNIKNPKEIIDAGWHVEPIIPSAFGILIFMIGFFYSGLFMFGSDDNKKGGRKLSDFDKKVFDAKERIENNLIPLFGVTSFLIFGIYLVVKNSGWWSWIFIAVGGVGIVYFMIDLIPSITEYFALKRIQKYKNNSLSVDDDFDKFEKSLEEENKKKARKKNRSNGEEEEKADEFEVEETYEIKSLDTKKKKKK